MEGGDLTAADDAGADGSRVVARCGHDVAGSFFRSVVSGTESVSYSGNDIVKLGLQK